jgi:alkylation response protein AidB-like acyl-CoA dehydrogenase
MDFELSDEQVAIRDLAAQVLTDKVPPERVRAAELDPEGRWFADDAWAALAQAGLLALCLPEDVGGSGFGIFEACLLLEQQGRTVAPLPLLPTLVYGALPVAHFGSPAQRAALLPAVATGETILTAAIHEPGDVLPAAVPSTAATADGDGWRLDGHKILVPAAHLAARVLVPAATGDGRAAVFLVDPAASGVHLERQEVTTEEPQWDMTLEGVTVGPDAMLGRDGQGAEIVAWIVDRALAGLCAQEAGVCSRAVEITAVYLSEREQFGSKIGTFQAVSQRAADAFIDTQAIALTAMEAAWRLSTGLPADDALAVAKFWAADGGQRVVHACQHLHGGIGVDVDYPIHRYFRWTKQIELTLGGATPSLVRLGAMLAAAPA